MSSALVRYLVAGGVALLFAFGTNMTGAEISIAWIALCVWFDLSALRGKMGAP